MIYRAVYTAQGKMIDRMHIRTAESAREALMIAAREWQIPLAKADIRKLHDGRIAIWHTLAIEIHAV